MLSLVKNIADGNGQVTSKIENLPNGIVIKRFILKQVDAQGAIQQQQQQQPNANSLPMLKLDLPIIKQESSVPKPNVKIIGQIDKIDEILEGPEQNPAVVNDDEKDDPDSEVNSGEETFVCSICDCSFPQKRELFRHFRKFHHHHPSNHSCLSCRQEFDSIIDLDEHKKVHIEEFENQSYNDDDEEKKTDEETEDKTPESDEKAHDVVRNSNLRKNRIKNAHRVLRDGFFRSDNPGLTQIFLPSLMNGIPDHVLATGSIKNHQALKKCQELPIPNIDLSDGLQPPQPVLWWSTTSGLFPCTVCSAKFESKQELCQHLSGHYKEKPYECRTCGLGFKCQNQRSSHMAAVHKPMAKFQCDHCERTFRRKSNLEQHIQSHFKPSHLPFKCKICLKEFIYKTVFRRHLNVHKREDRPELLSSSSSSSNEEEE